VTADVVVVGAGHAGCEAAAAAARMGARVVVVTLSRARVAHMPCNPAVGGVGKGHLVAEIDALGGLQGWAADRAGLQFKTLNASRGPAVWGPRAQCDKVRYSRLLGRLLTRLEGLELVEGEVIALDSSAGRVAGVRLRDGRRIAARAVILTTGTFLGGVLHTGPERRPGGRADEPASEGLGASLSALGLELRRFKTGTPPRLRRASLDYARLREEHGDDVPRPFSWRTREVRNRVLCWSARTPAEVQTIIQDNLHRSPLFSGQIVGTGPRYCPSIEDKVVRFPHHTEHTLFIEPESRDGESMYVNGLATSLPRDVQERVVRSVPGLERAEFLRYGYAVEYDVVAAREAAATLEVRGVPGLWLAGQVLGTSGYEEAAGLGLVAGANAVLALRGAAPLVLGRDEAYLGVLVDDLVRTDHREPYRMMTSRAEHRLLLGVDSARERLMARGVALGLVPQPAFHVEQVRWAARARALEMLEVTRLNPNRATRRTVRQVCGVELSAPTTWAGVLRRADVDPERAAARHRDLAHLGPEDRRVVLARVRYAGYLERQRREVARVRRLREAVLPSGFAPRAIPGLSREVLEALERYRPRSLGEAAALPGVTPAAVAILAGWLSRHGGA